MTNESQELTALQRLLVEEAAKQVAAVNFVELVEKEVSKCIKHAVTDLFSYSGPVAKQIKEAVLKAGILTDEDDLGKFTVAVRETVKAKLNNAANKAAAQSVGEMLERLLPEQNVISLKELKRLFREKVNRVSDYAEEDDYEDDEDDGDYLWEISSSSSSVGYWDLAANATRREGKYGNDSVFMRFHPCSEQPELDVCWGIRTGEHKHELQAMFAGPLYGFDAAVWRLGSGVAKLSRAPTEAK